MLDNLAIDTKLQPSTETTANDNCDWMITYEDETPFISSNFNYGAFDNPSFVGVTAIDNTGFARAGTYSTAYYKGTTNAGDTGVYLNNRVSATYAEIVVNGDVVGTTNTVANTPPVRTYWLNALNRVGGGYRNQSRFVAWGSYGQGLDATTRDFLSASKSQWQNTLKRKKSMKTKQIVWEGNSFNTYWFQALQRGVQIGLGSDAEWQHEPKAIGGRKLKTIDSEYASKISGLYNPAYTQNIFLVNETVNDYTKDGDMVSTKASFDSLITKALADGYTVVVLGGPVRKYQSGFHANVVDQTNLNLQLDDFQNYIRTQSVIRGYTYVEPPSSIWVNRSDYATDNDYDLACSTIFNNPLIMELSFSHPTEETCIYDWSPVITTAIENL